ncbi:MAG: PAS domain-containing sensor histidine kinase [Desulfobacteria bacterium]
MRNRREEELLRSVARLEATVREKEEALARERAERIGAEAKGRILDALMEHVPEGVIIADAPGVTVRMVSKRTEEMIGRSREALEGLSIDKHPEKWVIYHDDGVTQASGDQLPVVRATKMGEVVLDEEWVLRRTRGEPIRILVNACPIRDTGGRITGGIAVWRDITARKRMEEALQQSEALYRGIGESIDYGVWVCASDGRNTYASKSFLDMVGITQEQCSNFGWGEALHPDDAERTIAGWKECVRTGDTWDIEHRFRGVDGRWHHVLARGVPIKNKQGEITNWAGINLNIAKRKMVEEELRRSEERLRRVARAGRIGLYEWNISGGIPYWSPETYELLGCEPEAAPGLEEWIGRVHPGDRERVTRNVTVAMEHARTGERGDPLRDEYRVVHRDGTEHWLEATTAFDLEDGNLVMRGAVRDISGRKRAEVALANANKELETRVEDRTAELRKANKLLKKMIDEGKRSEERLTKSRERLRNLTGSLQSMIEEERARISREIHDELGQALTAMKLGLSVTRRNLASDGHAGLSEKIHEIEQDASRVIRTIRRIATELRPGVLDELGVSAAIEWVVKDFQNRTGIGCEVTIKAGENISDPARATAIFRIVQESLTNIMRHASATQVKVKLEKKGHTLILEVRDNGVGIGEGRIFAPMSLGLTGIRERVRILGGQTEISGIPGEGTLVRVTLPKGKKPKSSD